MSRTSVSMFESNSKLIIIFFKIFYIYTLSTKQQSIAKKATNLDPHRYISKFVRKYK